MTLLNGCYGREREKGRWRQENRQTKRGKKGGEKRDLKRRTEKRQDRDRIVQNNGKR